MNDTQNNTIKEVDYLDGFQYAGGVLSDPPAGSFAKIFLKDFLTLRPPTAEGYVAATQGTKTDSNGNLSYIFNYVYNYTDHLGNIRLSYTKDPVSGELEIMEENHYYPFGLKHAVYADPKQMYKLDEEEEELARPTYVYETEYQYKYNGKEFQDELNLNWLDYGWRNYMPDLGRWVTPDPLLNDLKTTIDFDRIMNETDDDINMLIAFASKMEVGGGVYNPNNLNPFSYGYNNPVSFDDPDGRCPICIVGVFLLFGGSVAMNSTGDHDGDQQKIQTAVSTQRNILVGTATGGAGTARGTVTTVVGASKNSGNANKTQTVQKGTQKTQNTKTSSKNEKHGDGGKQLSKSDKQIKQLESQKEGATKKEVKQINQKIKNIRENAQKSKKGEEHSRTNKR